MGPAYPLCFQTPFPPPPSKKNPYKAAPHIKVHSKSWAWGHISNTVHAFSQHTCRD